MTLDNKNNERLSEIAFIPNRRLGRSGKAPDGVRSLLAGIRIGRRSSDAPPGSQPQHIVPDRGEVVTAPIFVNGKPLHPDVDYLSNNSPGTILVLLLIF